MRVRVATIPSRDQHDAPPLQEDQTEWVVLLLNFCTTLVAVGMEDKALELLPTLESFPSPLLVSRGCWVRRGRLGRRGERGGRW